MAHPQNLHDQYRAFCLLLEQKNQNCWTKEKTKWQSLAQGVYCLRKEEMTDKQVGGRQAGKWSNCPIHQSSKWSQCSICLSVFYSVFVSVWFVMFSVGSGIWATQTCFEMRYDKELRTSPGLVPGAVGDKSTACFLENLTGGWGRLASLKDWGHKVTS